MNDGSGSSMKINTLGLQVVGESGGNIGANLVVFVRLSRLKEYFYVLFGMKWAINKFTERTKNWSQKNPRFCLLFGGGRKIRGEEVQSRCIKCVVIHVFFCVQRVYREWCRD